MAHASVDLIPPSLSAFYDPTTGVVKQVNVYIYAAGTLDVLTTYEDSELSVAHSTPIPSGGSGRIPPIFMGLKPDGTQQHYRFRAYALDGTLLEDVDGLPGPVPPPATVPPPVAVDTNALFKTGDIIAMWATAINRAGFVRANGNTIGNAASGATERANADTEALFTWLWQQDTALQLTVSGGKGGSAAADFAANKTITLPDLRGRALFGAIGMGAADTTRLQNGLKADGTAITGTWGNGPGYVGGFASHTLTTAQIPAHNHAVTDPTHAHGVSDPSHNHGHSDPGHAHGVSDPTHRHDIGATVTGGYGAQAGSSSYAGNLRISTGTGYDSFAATGISINAATTGIANTAAYTGISINAAGTGISIQNTGGGGNHNTLPPFSTITWYIKL